jgi:GAF domain-containing protein/HAMP domain-containing protein
MTENIPTPSATLTEKTQTAMRVALIMLGAAIVVDAFYIFLAIQMGAWQMYALAGVIAGFVIANLIAAAVIRQGMVTTGGWIMVIGMVLIFPAAGALISNIGLIFAAALILLVITVATQTLPAQDSRSAILVSVFAGLGTFLMDFVGLEYRLYVPEIQAFIPIVTVATLLIMLATLFMRYRTVINNSLQLKITVWTGLTLTIVSIVLVSYSVIASRNEALAFAEAEALAIADSQAQTLRAESEIPLDTARALAQAFTAITNPEIDIRLSRSEVNGMLQQVLESNPGFLGTYTLWEPNAFDGRDDSFRNRPGHDETGRFIPYFVRGDNNQIQLIPLEQYETPGVGDWYLLPRQTQRETVLSPLIYPIQGVDTVMASFVAPIVHRGVFYGIAGVDAPITFAQEIIDEINLYEGEAQAALFTIGGTLISVRNQPELVNQPANSLYPDFAELQPRLRAGEAFISISPDGLTMRVFAPVSIGKSGEPWVLSLLIPMEKLTEQANALALQETTISVSLILLALALLWALSAQIVRPILALTAVANRISQGDLNVKAEIDAQDETGTLAKAFNLMVEQVQQSFATLEQRVAERTQNLELAANVGRALSQVRDLDDLLSDATELIRSSFDLYYAQVYLIDPSASTLVLRSGTGSVGAELIGRAHSLPLNTNSINGRAAIEKQTVIVADTTANASFRPNPLLPDTRSEMAVPLIVGNQVVGVLDLQSATPGALGEQTLSTFEALAGQLAITIRNASLLEQTIEAQEQLQRQARRLERRTWLEYMDAIHKPEQTGFVFENDELTPLEAASATQTDTPSIVAPIEIVGETIGALTLELDESKITVQNTDLANIVARQVAQHIESLRLLDSAERYRMEAEEAARRLTREGWSEFMDERGIAEQLGYIYHQHQVKPSDGASLPVSEKSFHLPLKVRDEAIGKLAIMDVDNEDTEAVEIAQAVAERLSAHIESLRQFEETQRGQIELDKRARQLASVAEISTASSRELDIEKMLEIVVHLTQRKFGLYHAHVFTHNEVTQQLEIVACGWKEGDEHEGTHGTTTIAVSQEQSLVARAARERAPVIVNDVHNEPGWLPNAMLPDTQAEMAVPLIIGDKVLGVLDVQAEHLGAFSQEDASIYTTLAAQVATALQNAQSFARAQMQAEREAKLNVISQKIQSATSVEAVLQIAARELGHALGAPRTIAQLSLKDKK